MYLPPLMDGTSKKRRGDSLPHKRWHFGQDRIGFSPGRDPGTVFLYSELPWGSPVASESGGTSKFKSDGS